MIKFIHTADLHFGMENYGKIDSTTGIHSRLIDFEKALNFCIDTALEKDVDFFLFCGDAYKTTNPTPTQQKLLLNCFLRLYKKNIPIVIIIGNHDNPVSFGKVNSLDVFEDLPLDGFHVVSKPKIVNLKTKSGTVQIAGIPWPSKNNITLSQKHILKSSKDVTDYICKTIGEIINSFAKKLDPKIPSILAGHLTVSTGIFSGSEKRAIYGNDPTFLPSQLAIPPFDYVALGHLHRYQNLNPQGYPAIIYPGSIERIDFGERKEDKGFCLVTLRQAQGKPISGQEKQTTKCEFIKTPTRPFIQLDIKLKEDEDQTKQIVTALKKQNMDGAIVKIIYHVPESQKDTVNLQMIQQECVKAMHVVGIIPVLHAHTREKRSTLKVSMDFETLLGAYLDTKPEIKNKKKKIIEKALLLFEQSQFFQQETS